MSNGDEARQMTLAAWLATKGTRTGTYTINGVIYRDMNEVEWRMANDDWTSPAPK